MKKLLNITLLFVMAFTFVQCSDDNVELLDNNGPLSRSIAPIEESETNPTLLTDWENCETINLNTLNSMGQHFKAHTPWSKNSNSTLNIDFCNDIKSSDGWTMLFHTFCNANTDVNIQYMCFYNIFTGYLKVFYYSNKNDIGTATTWNLSCADYKTPQPLFADLEYFSHPLEGEKIYSIWSVTTDNMTSTSRAGIREGWNGFEFRIGEYQPSITTKQLTIDALNTLYTEINIDGITASTTTGTIVTTNNSVNSKDGNVEAYTNVDVSAAKEKVDSIATDNYNKSYLGINFDDIIEDLSSGDYASAFKKGLGAIFKGSSKEEQSEQPEQYVSDVKLQTNGTLKLSANGNTQISSKASTLTFDLEEVLSCNRETLSITSIDSTGSITPCYLVTTDPISRVAVKKELGVWNLKKKPTVYYDRYSKFKNENHFTENELMGGMLDFIGMANYPNTNATLADNEVVFNPAIKDYVKSYSVNVSLIDVTGGNRVLNNKGKHIIECNKSNKIKKDKNRDITIYGVGTLDYAIYGSLYDYPSNYINENTQYYLDWGENVGGNRAAVVTLTMDIDYNGKKMSLTESRVYDVDYKPRWLGQPVNNPPYSVVLNKIENNLIGFDLPTMR